MKKIYVILISVLALVMASCGKQDAVYKEFIKEGGYIYPAKAINVTADRGFKRIVLHWEKPMDPSIRTAKLFWDSRRESVDFDYASYPDGIVETVIDNLEDRSYTFEIVNYDDSENSSLAAEITSSPFADSWLVSHAERTMKFCEMDGTDAVITMGKPTDEIVSTKFRYVNASGQTVVSKAYSAADAVVRLPNAKKYKYLEYQSAFCAAEGIDTVWTGNWMKSPSPVTCKPDPATTVVTVTANQIRDNFKPELVLDGIKDSSSSRWYSSNVSAYRNIFPKILVFDTKLSGDNALSFNHFVFYEDPDPEGQTRRYIRSISIYVGDKKYNPDDTNFLTNFGKPVVSSALTQLDPVQDFVLEEPARGRYIAIVFRNSFNTTGFIDLWEFEAFGFVAKDAN